MGFTKRKAILISLIVFFAIDFLSAQTVNYQIMPSDKIQLGFNFDKTFYSENMQISALSGVYQLYFNFPVSSKLNLNIDVPFSYLKSEYNTGYGVYNYDRKGIGNIFIGLQSNPIAVDNRRSIISFGVFLPTGDEQAAQGLYANYYDLQKYVPNTLGLYFNYAYCKIDNEGFNYGLEVGPNVLIPTKGKGAASQLFFHYGLRAGYQVSKLLLDAQLLGIFIVSGDANVFSDRFIHLLNFGAEWKESTVTPRIYYRIYLKEEMSKVINGVLGIGVSVSFD